MWTWHGPGLFTTTNNAYVVVPASPNWQEISQTFIGYTPQFQETLEGVVFIGLDLGETQLSTPIVFEFDNVRVDWWEIGAIPPGSSAAIVSGYETVSVITGHSDDTNAQSMARHPPPPSGSPSDSPSPSSSDSLSASPSPPPSDSPTRPPKTRECNPPHDDDDDRCHKHRLHNPNDEADDDDGDYDDHPGDGEDHTLPNAPAPLPPHNSANEHSKHIASLSKNIAAAEASRRGHALSSTAVVFIVIAAVVVALALVGVLAFVLLQWRRRRDSELYRQMIVN